MKRTLFGILCLLVASLTVSSCQEVQGTEVVFEFWSDLAPGEVTHVDLEVVGLGPEDDPRDGDGCVFRDTLEAADIADGEELFFTYAVRPGNNCNEQVFMRATLRSGSDVLAVSGAGQDFEEGQSKRARIYVPARLACDAGQLWCDTVCSDGATDTEHCGWCRNTCPDNGFCRAGWCECPEGWEVCDDACVNLQKDPDNCGGCGTSCGADQACVNGSCSGDCAPLTRCGRTCIDTEGDRLNCGSCGNVCPSGVCIGGSCDASCEAPRLGGDCDPLAQCGCPAGSRCDAVYGPYDDTGPEHCWPVGEAGPMEPCDDTTAATTCGPGLACVPTGAVWGPEAPPFPDLAQALCRKWCLLGDDSTCESVGGGSCAQLSGQATYGVCYPYMEPETCNGVDDDLDANIDYLGPNFDPYNCGYCGNYCDSGSCFEGACQTRCEDSFLATCDAGVCIDTRWDRYFCGSCPPTDIDCGTNEVCHDGMCMPGEVGDPCEEAANCSGIVVDPLCAYELLGWAIPGGYCTRECDPGARPDPCPVGARCVQHPSVFPPTGFCLKTCPLGDSGVCRQSQGYQCVGDGTAGDYFCLPVGTREPTD